MNPRSRPQHLPTATYRLQFNRSFTLSQAGDILDYLRELGISDLYASPLFQAAPESTHGYDVCCFGVLNPTIGNDDDFQRFSQQRKALGLGLLLDMVPNHMSASSGNAWWLDVLEHGRDSKYAGFFDIDWDSPHPASRNKVLLPVLGDRYGTVLESGQLKLAFRSGKFVIGYYDKEFPVASGTLPEDLARAALTHDKSHRDAWLSRFNGTAGAPDSFNALHELLQRQHYRLAWWRAAAEQLNYRRFFDVTELVSLRMEQPEVFSESHAVIAGWLRAGWITGLRIDHPDGLRDPKQYFERLQSLSCQCGLSEPLYLVAEKILTDDEPLPGDWPVHGTTGYDFLNRANGLFVDSVNQVAFDDLYRSFLEPDGRDGKAPLGFDDWVRLSKLRMLDTTLNAELDSLVHRLLAVACAHRRSIDFTRAELRSALMNLIAAFPVYRTYLTESSTALSAAEEAALAQAIKKAREISGPSVQPVHDFLGRLLNLQLESELAPEARRQAREFVLRFQQLTGPVMAKGLEDTAFYNYNRLISLNEVGGNPGRFGTRLEDFHAHNQRMAAQWPHTLLATATHDTKRGEDSRARIHVLSELPGIWRDAIARWANWNARFKTKVRNRPAPSRNDEYLLYQSIVGALPSDSVEADSLQSFRDRATAFLLKAIRESKANTSWLDPDPEYESAIKNFMEQILADTPDNCFLHDLRNFTAQIAFFGRINSLSQTVLKLASPGVPDIYQGTELEDLSFVDPDNRRPVDFELRRGMLSELQASWPGSPPAVDSSGKAKLFVLWRALALRNRLKDLFAQGDYVPLITEGAHHRHLCAFARNFKDWTAVAVVPRCVATLTRGAEVLPIGADVWNDTRIQLPARRSGAFVNAFTREQVLPAERDGRHSLSVADVLKSFPVALLEG